MIFRLLAELLEMKAINENPDRNLTQEVLNENSLKGPSTKLSDIKIDDLRYVKKDADAITGKDGPCLK